MTFALTYQSHLLLSVVFSAGHLISALIAEVARTFPICRIGHYDGFGRNRISSSIGIHILQLFKALHGFDLP
jgi:hypothetical protein